MAYPVTKLVTGAWYLSNIVSREFQTVTGEQLSEGIDLLNAWLDVKTADQKHIPYYKEYAFNAVTGQEKYEIDNLVLPESLTFSIGDVRYSMVPKSRKEYFATARINNIDSLPSECHYERRIGGSDLYIYFEPDQNYPMKLWGKFSLGNVSEGDDLEEILDKFYIEYTRYGLAQYMCQEYNTTFPLGSKQYLNSLEQLILDISPLDMTITKTSNFKKQGSFNWGDVNIGRGWRP